jgi:hypothetical protein
LLESKPAATGSVALFGKEAAKPYDELFKIRTEILVAVRSLPMTYQDRREGSLPQDRKSWEATIGWALPEQDLISSKLDGVVKDIEAICRPSVEESAK